MKTLWERSPVHDGLESFRTVRHSRARWYCDGGGDCTVPHNRPAGATTRPPFGLSAAVAACQACGGRASRARGLKNEMAGAAPLGGDVSRTSIDNIGCVFQPIRQRARQY